MSRSPGSAWPSRTSAPAADGRLGRRLQQGVAEAELAGVGRHVDLVDAGDRARRRRARGSRRRAGPSSPRSSTATNTSRVGHGARPRRSRSSGCSSSQRLPPRASTSAARASASSTWSGRRRRWRRRAGRRVDHASSWSIFPRTVRRPRWAASNAPHRAQLGAASASGAGRRPGWPPGSRSRRSAGRSSATVARRRSARGATVATAGSSGAGASSGAITPRPGAGADEVDERAHDAHRLGERPRSRAARRRTHRGTAVATAQRQRRP